MPRSIRLNRRTVLRGAVAGAGVLVPLGPLDCMFDGNGKKAYGQGALPKRLVMGYFGNGCYHPAWVPAAMGPAPPLPESLKGLEPVRQYMRMVSGLDCTGGGSGHDAGNLGTLMGKGNTTFDQVAVPTLSAGARFPSLQYGLMRVLKSGKYQANTSFKAGSALPPELYPDKAFDRLFGAGYVPPAGGGGGPPPPPDPALEKLRLRKISILDGVIAQIQRLQTQVGATDKAKLEEHLTSIRELERSLQPLSGGGGGTVPANTVCRTPMKPATATDYPTLSRQFNKLIALAFACDQTRVISYQYGGVQCMTPFAFVPGAGSEAWHDASHGGGWQGQIAKILGWVMTEWGDMHAQLAGISEGAGKLIDSVGTLITSETGEADPHGGKDMPIVMGGGPKILTGNFHWRGSGTISGAAPLSLLKALGCPVTALGMETNTIPLI